MWNATINSKDLDNGVLTVYVDFSDGDKTITKSFSTTDAVDNSWLEAQVNNTISSLEVLTTYFDSLEVGTTIQGG